ncbi:MAG: tetraacyldisaccharide 4'-kinase [bacterium]
MDIGRMELLFRQIKSTSGLLEFIILSALAPFSFVNILYSTIRRLIYYSGIIRKYNFNKPLVSIGNINLGGSGKTPLVIYIANKIISNEYKPVIVVGWKATRDETFIYKSQLADIPVFSSKSKINAIKRASESDCDVILIDDGFQLLNVTKNMDIVIIRDDVSSLPFPLGWGRENPTAIKYANYVLISKRCDGFSIKYVKKMKKPVFTLMQIPEEIMNISSGKRVKIDTLRGEKILLFSMVPSINYISEELKRAGLSVRTMQFPDHYKYRKSDINIIHLKSKFVRYTITTEKDIINIKKLLPEVVNSLWILNSKIVIKDEIMLITPIIELIKKYK